MSRLTPEQTADALAQMRASDNVKLRDIAAIGRWLLDQPWFPTHADAIGRWLRSR